MHQQQEFTSLITKHQKIIYKVCNLYVEDKTDRQDLFQEICFQAWKSYHLFRGDAQFSTWLYRIALNTAITFFKKEKKQIEAIYSEVLPELRNVEDEREEQFKAIKIDSANNCFRNATVNYIE